MTQIPGRCDNSPKQKRLPYLQKEKMKIWLLRPLSTEANDPTINISTVTADTAVSQCATITNPYNQDPESVNVHF